MKKTVCIIFVVLMLCSSMLALTACKKTPVITWSYDGISGDTMTEEEFWERVGDQQDIMIIYNLDFGKNVKRYEAKSKRFLKELEIDTDFSAYYVSTNPSAEWVVIMFFSQSTFRHFREQFVDNAESKYFGEIIVTVSVRYAD